MAKTRLWIIPVVAGVVLAAGLAGWRLTTGQFPWERLGPTTGPAVRGPAKAPPKPPAGSALELDQPARAVATNPDMAAIGIRPPAPDRVGIGPAGKLIASMWTASRIPPAAVKKLFDQWTDQADKSPQFYCLLGKLALDSDRPVEAERYFNRACELAPKSPFGYIGLALIASGRKELDRAGQLLEKAIALDPWNVEAIYNLGVLRNRQSQFHDAETLYRKVLSTQPDHYWASFNLAVIAGYYSRLSEEEELWERIVAKWPLAVEPRYRLGMVYLNYAMKSGGAVRAKYCDQAIAQFEVFRAARPRDPDGWNMLGHAYRGKGDYEASLRNFQQAYNLARNDVIIINNLADIHLVMHKEKPAESEHLKAAIRLWQKSQGLKKDQPFVENMLKFFKDVPLN